MFSVVKILTVSAEAVSCEAFESESDARAFALAEAKKLEKEDPAGRWRFEVGESGVEAISDNESIYLWAVLPIAVHCVSA